MTIYLVIALLLGFIPAGIMYREMRRQRKELEETYRNNMCRSKLLLNQRHKKAMSYNTGVYVTPPKVK